MKKILVTVSLIIMFSIVIIGLNINKDKEPVELVVLKKYEFEYTGRYQEFKVSESGYYKIELFGSSGGGSDWTCTVMARGGYVAGTTYLNKDDILYVYVGEAGKPGSASTKNQKGIGAPATFNGGGKGGDSAIQFKENTLIGGSSGGGSTDVRLISGDWDDTESLKSRIMVAGAGGGSFGITPDDSNNDGGNNDGLIGQDGTISKKKENNKGIGATNNSGYDFGIGGPGANSYFIDSCYGNHGGGGGYFGGTGGSSSSDYCYQAGGGAGSSFVSGCKDCLAVDIDGRITDSNIHYSNITFEDIKIEGSINSGNGKAIISLLKR